MTNTARPIDDNLSDLFGGTPKPQKPLLPSNYVPIENQPRSEPCRKCNGSGRWGWYQDRQCFACKGTGRGKVYKTSPTVRAENRAKAAERKARTLLEDITAFKTEHPAIWEWMDGSKFEFAVSLQAQLLAKGYLSQPQIDAAYRSISHYEQAKEKAKARVIEAKAIDMTAIDAAFARASAVLKSPLLRVASFKIGPSKRYAGLYVVKGDILIGKIVDGKFVRNRTCSDQDEAELLEIAKDPKRAAEHYGRLTGHCAICARLLTHKDSLERGIGPICAEKFGW